MKREGDRNLKVSPSVKPASCQRLPSHHWLAKTANSKFSSLFLNFCIKYDLFFLDNSWIDLWVIWGFDKVLLAKETRYAPHPLAVVHPKWQLHQISLTHRIHPSSKPCWLQCWMENVFGWSPICLFSLVLMKSFFFFF